MSATTITRKLYQGQRLLVVGLGASGVSALRYLLRAGAEVVVTDSRAAPAGIDALRAEYPEVSFLLGVFQVPQPLGHFDAAVVSPGVALDEPLIRNLQAAGVPVIGDIELFARAANAPVIGITGSNGKSTVTTLVGEIAEAAGLRVQVGGNLGTPALDLLRDDTQLYVLELSSFQLETTHSLKLLAAAYLNLSEDHLDRHGSMSVYGGIKSRIFSRCEVAVINRDDAATAQNASAAHRIVSFGLDAPGHQTDSLEYGLGPATDSATAKPSLLIGRGDSGARLYESILPVDALRIAGRHNIANALAAIALVQAAGIGLEPIRQVLARFSGLPHRCAVVAERRGAVWLNDSKGTNVGATLAALRGLDGPLIWLGGGQGKGQDFAPLAPPLAEKGRAAVLFGADAQAIEDAIVGALPVYRETTLDAAVQRAAHLVQPGDRVLLSPACASLDQFRNYVERGQRFAAAVEALA